MFLKQNLFLALFLIGANAMALVVPSGTTMTLNNVNITENIVVEPHAVLNIVGNVTMGIPTSLSTELYILVKDKGQLRSDNGSITGLHSGGMQRSWYGVIVEATPFSSPSTVPAIDLNNFTFKHAKAAIEMPRYTSGPYDETELIHRAIKVENTVFDDIINYQFNAAQGFKFGASWNDFAAENDINTVLFKDCDFLRAGGDWPFWAVKMRNLHVQDCFFDNSDPYGSAMGIHLRNVSNLKVRNSEFRRTGRAGIVFHGLGTDIEVYKNTFEFTNEHPLPENYGGICIGYLTNVGYISSANISYNTFKNSSAPQQSIAIVVGQGIMADVYGNIGYIHKGDIHHNSISGFANGIVINNDGTEAGAFYAIGEGPKDLEIYSNTIDNYNIGIELSSNCEAVKVFCNRLETGGIGFSIGDAYTTVENFGPIDLNNKFIGSALDIDNQTSDYFIYVWNALNSYRATTWSGPIINGSSPSLNSCPLDLPPGLKNAKKSTRLATDTEQPLMAAFPNPANEQLSVVVPLQVGQSAQIVVRDLQGKVVSRESTNETNYTLSTAQLAEGMYLLTVQTAQKTFTEKIAIQH